jgi:hypothetical protein
VKVEPGIRNGAAVLLTDRGCGGSVVDLSGKSRPVLNSSSNDLQADLSDDAEELFRTTRDIAMHAAGA